MNDVVESEDLAFGVGTCFAEQSMDRSSTSPPNHSSEYFMPISARNQFNTVVSKIILGAVNAEIELITDGGSPIVAIITNESINALGLAVGKKVIALVKAPWIIVVSGESPYLFSARNQLTGKVSKIGTGSVNSEITITLPGGTEIHSIITNDSVSALGLNVGGIATALFKSSHVILAVAK